MSLQTTVKTKGVSVNVISRKNLEGLLRIDAEYYQQKYFDILKKLQKNDFYILQDIASNETTKRNHTVFNSFNYLEVSSINIKNGQYIFERVLAEEAPSRAQKILKKHDVVVSTVRPNRNAVALIVNDFNDMVGSTGFCVIRSEKISPFYLFTFFKLNDVASLLDRKTTATMYPAVSEEDIMSLPIPKPTDKLEKELERVILEKIRLEKISSEKYNEAENLLLRELLLDGYKPNEENITIRNLKTCLQENRFDAEYWQPDFDVIQDTIKKHKDGFDTLNKLFELSDIKVRIDPEKEYLYAELADVSSISGTIDNFTELQGKELPSRGRMMLKKNDIIVSSVEGSLEKIALVLSSEKNIIGSTGFFVLRQKIYEPEVALVLLKSKPIQQLLKRQAQGTILTAIPKASLSRILLPKINQSIQEKIKQKIAQSSQEQQEAKNLLEKAKKAVEIFIEQSEKEALEYLK